MRTYLIDLAERVGASFLGGMVVAMTATGEPDLTDPTVWIGGAVGGAFAAVKGLVAYYAAERGTASLVSTRTPPQR